MGDDNSSGELKKKREKRAENVEKISNGPTLGALLVIHIMKYNGTLFI